jgi:hypothetical protein
MVRIVLSVLLGLFSFIVASIADEFLTTPGHRQTPPGTFFILVVYLLVAQFLVAHKGVGLRSNFPTLAAMAAPLGLMFVGLVVAEKPQTILNQGTLLLCGCIGALLGAFLAGAWPLGGKRAHG